MLFITQLDLHLEDNEGTIKHMWAFYSSIKMKDISDERGDYFLYILSVTHSIQWRTSTPEVTLMTATVSKRDKNE